MNKIIAIEQFSFNSEDSIVCCYGHFNLIHPGHLRYLQHAKTLAEKLVVLVRSDEELEKDSLGEHYSENERAESLANLHIVDFVIILNQITLEESVNLVKPSILVLGKEFEQGQPKQVELAVSTVLKQGKVVYHAGDISYATSNLLYGNVSDIEKKRIDGFKKICEKHKLTLQTLQNRIESISSSRMLVIGDTIVDNYVACDAIGMSAEAPVLVVKELESREFLGGAAIVASHVRALGAECHYISVVGEDAPRLMVDKTLKDRGISSRVFIDPTRPTTYKTRYLVEQQKLFRVSRINDHKVSVNIEQDIINELREKAPNIDGIIISDFLYGVITQKIIDEINILAKQFRIKIFGDMQCSSQMGKVTKFKKFDLITPTEKEARLALDDSESGLEWIGQLILNEAKSKNLLITLGADGFIAYSNESPLERQDFPALTVNPVDVAGAGDSLLASVSVALTSGANLIEASAIGACMASLAVKEVGNTPIGTNKLNGYLEIIFILSE